MYNIYQLFSSAGNISMPLAPEFFSLKEYSEFKTNLLWVMNCKDTIYVFLFDAEIW